MRAVGHPDDVHNCGAGIVVCLPRLEQEEYEGLYLLLCFKTAPNQVWHGHPTPSNYVVGFRIALRFIGNPTYFLHHACTLSTAPIRGNPSESRTGSRVKPGMTIFISSGCRVFRPDPSKFRAFGKSGLGTRPTFLHRDS